MAIFDRLRRAKSGAVGNSVALGPERTLSAAGADGLDAGRWYLSQAKAFEKSQIEGVEKRAVLAWRFAQWMGVVTSLAIIGISCLALLKRPNPPAVLRVDNATGKVDVLPTTADRISFGEKSDRADLKKYVEARESYDWETISDMRDLVMAMSTPAEATRYDTFIKGATSPLKVLKDQARVIARVGAITFVGGTAQVFFSKELVPLSLGAARSTTYWVATVAFEHDNVPEKREQQDMNATGWKETSYTVTRDWTRTPAGDSPSDAGPASGVVATGG
ncbi:virB8 family protein [Burkholderia ubonensis]|uniref:virB8 family protein n=1 Tax=Burkholderia ubonensis TaxID=101571 RepID=UPI0009B38AA5|nr:type IV secretion system protein [Burkholderia ubonensis]